MPSCEHSLQIDAPIHHVWSILTDFDNYPKWNPLIGKLKGNVAEQNFVLIYVVPLKMYVPVQITNLEAPNTLTWQAKVPSATVFQGTHYYQLKAVNTHCTMLQHGEFFTGMLSSFIPNFALSKLQDAYQYHNEKLKIIAENRFILKS